MHNTKRDIISKFNIDGPGIARDYYNLLCHICKKKMKLHKYYRIDIYSGKFLGQPAFVCSKICVDFYIFKNL